MKKTAKRILSLALVLAMTLGLSITASAADYSIQVGERATINAPIAGSAHDFQWSTSDSCVEIDGWNEGTANIVGLSAGSARIRVDATGDEGYLTEYVTVTVTGSDPEPAPAPEPSITIYTGSLSLEVGESDSISYDVSNTGGVAIEWRSSNTSVATVRGGTVTAVGEGTATITASVGGASDSCTVSVTAPRVEALSVSVSPQILMDEGGSQTISATTRGGDGRYSYEWYSGDESVARVSGRGSSATVSAVGGGRTTVTVVVNDGSGNYDNASCSVTVNAKARPTVATYSATGAATVGMSLAIDPIAKAIASQFRSQLGESLDYGADVYLSNPYDDIGGFSSNGERIRSGSHAYAMFESMAFDPYRAGTFSTTYTIQQGNLKIGGQITITVTGGAGITSVSMDASSLQMATYSSRYLNLNVNPSGASVSRIDWSSSNGNVATVSGNGRSATVTTYGRAGNAVITAVATDVNGRSYSATCSISVVSSATYNPTLTVTAGSDYQGTETSENMARQFRDVYGVSLNYNNAVIRFSSTGDSRYGVLRTANGRAISANTNYSFNEWVNSIWFEPGAAGTFSVPYTLTYNGNSLTGTFTIYIRGSSVSAQLSSSTLSLATYSSQDLSLSVVPANARYSVTWMTNNARIATVSGNSYMGRVETKGVAGTAIITARVTDVYGVSVDRQCRVTVTNSSTFNPSVSTYLGVSYTGTGTSDAMIKQFRNIYGVTLNTNNATIRFSSTGNNNVAVMRLKDGSAVRANTNYTMTQYIQMYTEPVAVGTFTIPYTLTYNSQSLTGSVSVGISGVSINSLIALTSTNAYPFNTAAANGAVGGATFASSITNMVGSSWQYIRFGAASNTGVGTLYRNASRAGLGTTNIYTSDLSNLYFVPSGTNGTYSIAFTVYNSGGGTLATGTLSIAVNAPTAANTGKAPHVVKSPQELAVNGTERGTEIYNIDNTNYFKLRDLAALLNGTPYQFNVDFNSATNTIVVRTRTPYTTANGYELQTGVDNSSKAVRSTQSLEINGVRVDLTAFNIGGTNFFGLRALEPYIGYTVGWDSATNTATITSR